MEKETVLRLRITPADKAAIQARADRVSMTLSAYTRKMLLDGQIHFIEAADRKTINGIANNLNQLTRQANSTQVIPPDVAELLKNLIKVLRHAYSKR